MSTQRAWAIFAGILAATSLLVWAGNEWENQHQQVKVGQLVDHLCAGTPDC